MGASEARICATIEGELTYIGLVHDRCGTSEKYTSNGKCALCDRASSLRSTRKKAYTPRINATEAIKQAKLDGSKFYHGAQCKNCGTTKKYVSTRTCRQCLSEPKAPEQASLRAWI